MPFRDFAHAAPRQISTSTTYIVKVSKSCPLMTIWVVPSRSGTVSTLVDTHFFF